MKKINLLVITALILFFGCEVTEKVISPESNISVINENVNTYEVVNINAKNTSLENSYAAQLGEIEITLNKVNDSSLVLFIPDIESGEYLLTFELGTINFNITQTEIRLSKEDVINGFKEQVQANFISTSDNPNSNGVAILENILTNASEQEKQAIALFFEANRETFTNIINTADNNVGESKNRYVNYDLNERVRRYNTNVFQLGIGAVAVIGASGLGASGVGAILAGAGLGLMYDAIPAALNEGNGMIQEGTRQLDFELIEASSSRMLGNYVSENNNSLSFMNKKEKFIKGNYDIRGLDKTDRELINVFFFNTFFSSFDNLNGIISKINFVIDIANEIPFVNIELFNSGSIPEAGTSRNELIDSEVFSNYSFAVENSEIGVNVSLKETGRLQFTFIADESLDLSEPISTRLIANYKDELNEISKYFDITINDTLEFSLVGTWNMENLDGERYATGTEFCNDSSNQYSTLVSLKFAFSNETFVETSISTVEDFPNGICTENGWQDQGDTDVYNETVNTAAEWTLEDNILITVYDNGTDSYSNTLNIIDNDNISITTEDDEVLILRRE